MKHFLQITLGLVLCTLSVKAQVQDARRILEANIEVTGGEEAWEAIKTLQFRADFEGTGDEVKVSGNRMSYFKYPGYRYIEHEIRIEGDEDTSRETWIFLVTPEKAWVKNEEYTLETEREDQLSLEGAKEELTILNNEKYQITDLRQGIFNESKAYEVTVSYDDLKEKRYYDYYSKLLLGVEKFVYNDIVQYMYSNYRKVGRVFLPFRIEILTGSIEGTQIYNLRNVRLNPTLDVNLFADINQQ